MDIQICTDWEVIEGEEAYSVIVHVTDFEYHEGAPGTGPTYSCGGTPPEPAYVLPTEGWVELDCCPCAKKERLDKKLKDDNAFDAICESDDDRVIAVVDDALFEYVDNNAGNTPKRAEMSPINPEYKRRSILD